MSNDHTHLLPLASFSTITGEERSQPCPCIKDDAHVAPTPTSTGAAHGGLCMTHKKKKNKNDEHWDCMFEQLVKYKEVHGVSFSMTVDMHCTCMYFINSKITFADTQNCNIPKERNKKELYQLANWVHRQKAITRGKNKGLIMPQDYRDCLEEIGFFMLNEISNKEITYDKKWTRIYALLVEYREKHGVSNSMTVDMHCTCMYFLDSKITLVNTQHCNDSQHDKENRKLTNWVKNQRKAWKGYQGVTLSLKHQNLLEDISFMLYVDQAMMNEHVPGLASCFSYFVGNTKENIIHQTASTILQNSQMTKNEAESMV